MHRCFVNTGTGTVPSGVSGLVTNQSISFNGFQFKFPASGAVSLVIDDLRANVNQLGLQQQSLIQAYLGGSLALEGNPVDPGYWAAGPAGDQHGFRRHLHRLAHAFHP
jgi:hypothetical protein